MRTRPRLNEQVCGSDHDASDERKYAGKQHDVDDEFRHYTLPPLRSPRSASVCTPLLKLGRKVAAADPNLGSGRRICGRSRPGTDPTLFEKVSFVTRVAVCASTSFTNGGGADIRS